MLSFESDSAQNLFVVRFSGHATSVEFSAQVEPMKQAIGKMRPGFGLLADLTNLELMDADCAPHIRAIMDYANAHGVAVVVRVIPDPHRDIGLQIMSRFHYGNNVNIVTCANVEEAMKILFD